MDRDRRGARLSELARTYLGDRRARSSAAYLERARGIAAALAAAWDDPPVDELDIRHLVAWQERRIDDGAALATINLELGLLRTMLRWGARYGLVEPTRITDFPSVRVREADRRRLKRALSADEVVRLLDAARRLDRRAGERRIPQAPLWHAFLGTGARRGELVGLRWSHVDLGAGRLRIAPETSKSGRERTLPLAGELGADLERLRGAASRFLGRVLGPRDHVFLSPLGVPWAAHPDNLNRALQRLLRHAGIARRDGTGRAVSPHALRHTVATHLARGGVHPRHAQAILGHADVRTTLEHYTHVDEGDVLGGLQRLAWIGGAAPRPEDPGGACTFRVAGGGA